MGHQILWETNKEAIRFLTSNTFIYTPCEKVMGLFFSEQIIYLLFIVVYPSFYTWHTWGGQYEIC